MKTWGVAHELLLSLVRSASETRFEKILRLRALDQDSKEWELARKEDVKISASEMPTICGAAKSSYSRKRLWQYKTGRIDELGAPSEYLQTLYKHGKDTEPEAIEWFGALHCPYARVFKTGIWLLEDDPADLCIGATPDAVVEENGHTVPLEVKCPYLDSYQWTADREEKDMYQLMTQMACMRAPYGYLCYYISGRPSVIWKQWNELEWNRMYEAAFSFSSYVKHDLAPPPLSKRQLQKEREHIRNDRALAALSAAARGTPESPDA